jgi:recombination protein RecA
MSSANNLIAHYPTGSLRLDIALGIGGIPGGFFTEFCGPEASGKTTLCQHIIAEAQKMGGVCAFIDSDHTFQADYAKRCGVDLERLYFVEPHDAEQALDILETLGNSGAFAVIVLDSFFTLTPAMDLSRPISPAGESHSDSLMSHALRRLSGGLPNTGTAILITNQAQKSTSAVYHRLASNPARLALKMHAAVRLGLRSMRLLQEQGRFTGNCIQIRIIKNKFAPCPPPIVLDIIYGTGILKSGEVFDLGILHGIIKKDGAQYFYQDKALGDGRKEATEILRKNASICHELEQVIRQRNHLPATPIHLGEITDREA